MLKNHIKIAFRHLIRDRQFSLLNLFGLAVGMAACLAILQLVQYEWSYDRQSPHADNIWRVYCETVSDKDNITLDANTHSAIGPALDSVLPEVVEHTRLYNHNQDEVVFLQKNQPVKLANAWMVDPGFLNMFPQVFLAGDRQRCLLEPYSMVLTKSAAKRLFSGKNLDDDPATLIGQSLEVPAGVFQGIYTVKGIIADPPQNTHLKFLLLASYATRYAKGHRDNWNNYWGYTYFQTRPDANRSTVVEQLARFSQQHLVEDGLRLRAQAFTDIHLHSNLTYEIEANGNARAVNFMALIGIFILLIAFFNYVNMMTARALNRAGEVGIRKVVGATRGQLIRQFILEGVVLNGIALMLAILALSPLLTWLGKITGRPLAEHFQYDWQLAALAAGILLSSVLFSGLYPAFALSRFRPVQVLKGHFSRSREGQPIRKGLVVFQFACSTVLIVSVVIVSKQLSFMKNYDLGLILGQRIAIKMPELDYRQDTTSFARLNSFKEEIKKLPGYHSLTTAEALPGLGISTISGGTSGVHWVSNPEASSQAATYYLTVGPDFFEAFEVQPLRGQFYEVRHREDIFSNVIINESARRMLGFPDAASAVGEAVAFNRSPGRQLRVRAVVEDFHIESLKEAPRPTLYYLNPRLTDGYFAMQVNGSDLSERLVELENIWTAFFPINPMEFWFLDEHFNRQYEAEQRMYKAFSLFAGLAILIACIGLFGLAVYSTQQRTKEIGIRKVLGASIIHIVGLLTKDFLALVLMAILLAAPLGYYVMSKWLEDFAYRIEIPWWVFVLAGVVVLLISFVSVAYRTLLAAVSNPVESLRQE